MDEYISRQEHEVFAQLMESENEKLAAENKRQNKRLDTLEGAIRQINALAASVERLAASVENMAKEQVQVNKSLEKQGERLGALENRDGEKWRTVSSYVLTALVAAVMGVVMARLGLG